MIGRFRFEDLETWKLSLHFLLGPLQFMLYDLGFAPCAIRYALCEF